MSLLVAFANEVSVGAGSIASLDGTQVEKAPLDYLINIGLSPWYLPPSAHKYACLFSRMPSCFILQSISPSMCKRWLPNNSIGVPVECVAA